MSRNETDDTLRDMWATRPRRSKGDKKIAGVAAAIARRYQIDPTLVRVAFVVATIYGGVGIVLYLLGWLLLPEEGDEVSPAEAILGRGHSSMSVVMTCVLGLLLIPAGIAVVSGTPSVLVGLAVAGAALFLLHRHRGGMVATAATLGPSHASGTNAMSGTSGTGGTVTAASGVPVGASASDQPTTAGAPSGATGPIAHGAVPGAEPPRQSPPAWDPLGVAPFAWDLPEPAPEPPAEPPARKPRSAVTPVTIGLALVAAGIAAVTAMSSDVIGGRHVAAIALAVVGTGLVIGSFVRGGRGLIPLAIPLAGITWAMTAVTIDLENVGNREYTPTSVGEVLPHYQLDAGNMELDLTELELEDTDTVRTKVEMSSFGNVEVTVPENADVRATCSVTVGNVECLDSEINGADSSLTVSDDGEDGAGGGTFQLELIHNGTGNVELKRGD